MKKPVLDLAGMEADVAEITAALSRVISPKSSDFKKAVAEVAIARIGDGEKLATIFLMLMSEDGGASSEAPYRLIQKMMNVSRTRMDGVRKGLAEWEQLEITKGAGPKPSRYRLLKPVLNYGENVLVTRPWDCPLVHVQEDEQATRLKGHKATRLKGHKDASDPSEGSQPLRDLDQFVCSDVSTPTGCGDSGREPAPTSTLPSQNPDHINPDIARADSNLREDDELDALLAQYGVTVNCVTISHKNFILDLSKIKMAAFISRMRDADAMQIAKLQSLAWVTGQGAMKDEPTDYVCGIVRRSKPQMVANEQIIKDAIEKAKSGANQPVDRSNGRGYTEPTKEENDGFWNKLSAKIKEKENAKSNGPLPEAPKAIF